MTEPLEKINPMGAGGFLYYRKNAEHRQVKNTRRKNHYRGILNEFWGEVAKEMLERKGGVYVENFGYFCIGIVPIRKMQETKGQNKKYLNPKTHSYTYYPLFIPENFKLRTFSMDTFFSRQLKGKLKKKLDSGFKYLNYFTEIHENYMRHKRKK